MIDAFLSPLWPSWLGALALAGVSLGYFALTRGLIGASASFQRVLKWREGREVERMEAALPDDAASLEAMLLAATFDEFGASSPGARPEASSTSASEAMLPAKRLLASEHAIFLVCMILGGALSAWLAGSFELRSEIAPEIVAAFGSPLGAGLTLFFGGVIVGLGTSIMGGCTSGHGLSGCARLQPGSLLATAVFFGAGVAVAIALGAFGVSA